MFDVDFVNRLTALRLAKGVSAREMSLSIGQNTSYINIAAIIKGLRGNT